MMKTFKKALSITLALALVIASIPATFGVVSSEAPASTLTYDFTQMEEGTDVGAMNGVSVYSVFNPTNTNGATQYNALLSLAKVQADTANIYGTAGKILEIETSGKLPGAGLKSSAVIADFQYPEVIGNFPVKKFSGIATMAVPQNTDIVQGGTTFIIAKKTESVDEKNTTDDTTDTTTITKYLYTTIGLLDDTVNAYKTDGSVSSSISATAFSIGFGKIGTLSYDNLNTEPERSLNSAVSNAKKGNKNATEFVEYVINDNGEALTNIQKEALITYLNGLTDGTPLTQYQRQMEFALEDNGTYAKITIALPNVPGYADIECAESMPSKLRFTYNVNYTSGYEGYIGGIGWTYSSGTNVYTANDIYGGVQAINSLAIEYDTSSYYEAGYIAEADEFVALANSTLGGITAYKSADLDTYKALVAAYNALDAENVLPLVEAQNADIAAKIETLEGAIAVLEGGVDVYDTFENGLNWEIEGSYNANMVPTNTYDASYAVRTNDAVANSNAFWGVKDGALWLRKSFNTEYQKSNTPTIAQYPTVLAVPKTDIVPADKKIEKISGKMYYYKDDIYSNGYHAMIGTAYSYTSETEWSGIGLAYGYKAPINRTERIDEESQSAELNWKYLNGMCEIIEGADYLACSSNANQGVNCFAFAQWTDFSLEYDYTRGYYVYTLTGLHRDITKDNGCQNANHTTGEAITVKIGITDATELLGKVGLFNGNSIGESFDDIAITYADATQPEVPTAEELAEEFRTAYAAFELTAVDSAEDVALVVEAVAAYEALENADVKALLADEVAALTAMKDAYIKAQEDDAAAGTFTRTYDDAIALTEITDDDELAAVEAMLAAYDKLSDDVKALVGLNTADYTTLIDAYKTEKANKAAAADYEKAYAETFEITVIANDDELADVQKAIADYKALEPAVQAFVTVNIATYEGLVADYIAAKEAAAEALADANEYKETYKTTLEIVKIRTEVANTAVDTAIAAYNGLSEAAKAHLTAEIATLNALKAEYAEFLAKVYTPEIKGATIRREGTQTIGFKFQINDLREDVAVTEYGMIVTANSFIEDEFVSEDDLTLEGVTEKEDYVRAVSSDKVESVVSGAELIANIGNISSANYGVRYVVRVYIKYEDGTVDYSNVLGRSVISVAKSIAGWVFNNNVEGLATPITDIIKNANEDGTNIEYAYDVTTDNGVKILEYLEANNAAISAALNA